MAEMDDDDVAIDISFHGVLLTTFPQFVAPVTVTSDAHQDVIVMDVMSIAGDGSH